MNTLGYDNLDEVFFDVFQIRSKSFDLVKEKKGDFNGSPIVEVDLQIQDEIFKNVRFALTKENKISINPKLLDYANVVTFEKKQQKPVVIEKKEIVKPKKLIKEKKIVKQQPIIQEQNLVNKTKEDFLKSIRSEILEEVKNEIKQGIISDLIRENVQSNFNNVINEDQNKSALDKILENYQTKFRAEYLELAQKIAKREAMRYTEGGGGTNATQYENGGNINGNLYGNAFISDNFLYKNGDRIIKKDVRNISGTDFINGNYTLTHNLNTFDLSITLYYVNTDGSTETVFASILNDTLNTSQINFANQPDSNDNFKLVIIS